MSDNLTPADELDRDDKADHPGVNTARSNDVKPGSAAASTGVGDMERSVTEAARGTSANTIDPDA